MTRTTRFALFWVGGLGLFVLLGLSFLDLPHFGSSRHPYRDAAVAASLAHHTANAVSSVNFDQRAIDTLGEETILLASVVGVVVLLRTAGYESEGQDPQRAAGGRVMQATQLAAYAFFAVTLTLGADLVAHGHVTPGGGFQGGVVLATGLHLLYVSGRYEVLRRIRPLRPFEWLEAFGGAAFAALGVAGVALGAGFLANVAPLGSFGGIFSAGTVPVLNGVVAVEVAAGVVVLLSAFLTQAIEVFPGGDGQQ